MVNFTKIVKKGQLQMAIESREPILHSGFFRLKHLYTLGEQKKLHMGVSAGGYLLNKFPSDHGKKITKYAGAGWF